MDLNRIMKYNNNNITPSIVKCYIVATYLQTGTLICLYLHRMRLLFREISLLVVLIITSVVTYGHFYHHSKWHPYFKPKFISQIVIIMFNTTNKSYPVISKHCQVRRSIIYCIIKNNNIKCQRVGRVKTQNCLL